MIALRKTLGTWWTAIREARDPDMPPVHGWQLPYIGCGLEVERDGGPMFMRIHERYGDTCTLHVGKTLITLSKDEAFRQTMYGADVHHMSFFQALGFFTGIRNLLELGLTGPEQANMGFEIVRRVVLPRLRESPALLDAEMRRRVAALPPRGTVQPTALLTPMITQLTTAVLAGTRLSHDEAFLCDAVAFDLAVRRVTRSPLPGRAVRAGLRVRDRLVARIVSEIARRRAAPSTKTDASHGADFIDGITAASDPRGNRFPDEVSALELVGYLYATTVNTPAAAVMCLLHILADPALKARVRDEQQAVAAAHGDVLSSQGLRAMRVLTACLHETLRMYAPGLHVRVALVPTRVGRYHVPAGRMVAFSPYTLHHDPSRYTDPFVFDPDRFLEGPRSPAGSPRSADFVPFGRGPHACLGKNLARQEIMAALARLFRDWEMEPIERLDPHAPVEIDWSTNGLGAPKQDPIVRYRRRPTLSALGHHPDAHDRDHVA